MTRSLSERLAPARGDGRVGGGEPTPARTVGAASLRSPCTIEGQVVAVCSSPGRPFDLDVLVQDGTGTLLCQFTGRRALPGVALGTRLRVDGTLVGFRSRRCLLNPSYELLGADGAGDASS
jgi:hypothetical protein